MVDHNKVEDSCQEEAGKTLRGEDTSCVGDSLGPTQLDGLEEREPAAVCPRPAEGDDSGDLESQDQGRASKTAAAMAEGENQEGLWAHEGNANNAGALDGGAEEGDEMAVAAVLPEAFQDATAAAADSSSSARRGANPSGVWSEDPTDPCYVPPAWRRVLAAWNADAASSSMEDTALSVGDFEHAVEHHQPQESATEGVPGEAAETSTGTVSSERSRV